MIELGIAGVGRLLDVVKLLGYTLRISSWYRRRGSFSGCNDFHGLQTKFRTSDLRIATMGRFLVVNILVVYTLRVKDVAIQTKISCVFEH